MDNIFCIECGFKLPATAKFCKKCGVQIESAEAPAKVVTEITKEETIKSESKKLLGLNYLRYFREVMG